MTSPKGKTITVDADKCVGCHGCEMACSIKHFQVCHPTYSRIRIQEFREVNTFVPVRCQACEDAACIEVCPMDARVRLENGAVTTNETRCIGCHMCIYSCPFGAVVANPTSGKTMSCTMCEGDELGPWCVKACTMHKALSYVSSADAARGKAREWALKLKDDLQPPSAGKGGVDFEFTFGAEGTGGES